MPKAKPAQKRELENPADISISVAPTAAKKSKPQPPPTNTKTRSATKQAKSSEANTGADNEPVDNNPPADAQPTKSRKRAKHKAPPAGESADEPEDVNTATAPPTKAKKLPQPQNPTATAKVPEPNAASSATLPGTKPKKLKASKEPAPTAETEPVPEPDEDNELSSPSKKSARAKKPSEIAEKVSQQLAAQKDAKEAKAAKKQKKADAAVIVKTPQETAAFLAKMKGQTGPAQASSVVTSPKRQRPNVDRTKALNQLIASQPPSISPSLVSGVSAATGTSTRTSSIAPDDSISQVNALWPKKPAKPALQAPSTSTSRDVSPAAPPHPIIPSSAATSHGVSPATESVVTGDDDDDYDEAVEASTVDINSLLLGIPPPWNLGPAVPPPALVGPFHTVRLKPETIALIAQAAKDKAKRPRLTLNSFQTKDKKHLSLCIEYMEDFAVNIHGFPDDELRWIFASNANYLASKKLGRSYILARDSDHYRVLTDRLSQTRNRFVHPSMSDGIRENYEGLSWKPPRGVKQAEWQQTIRAKVTSMIQTGSYLAPDDEPMAYYQHPWMAHIIELLYWNGTGSRGFSKDHQEHFRGISIPLIGLTATAIEKQLAVVAAGPTAASAKHKNSATAFSHDYYMPRLNSHIVTLAQLFHHPEAGPVLIGYFTKLHEKFRSAHGVVAAIPVGPKPKLAIPIAALENYGAKPKPQDMAKGKSRAPAAGPRPVPNIDIHGILNNPNLTDEAKVIFMSAIYAGGVAQPPSGSHSSSAQSSWQYEGLWTEVNHDGNDSEVEARRAGALPPPRDQAKPSRKTRATDSDEEMHDGDEGGHEGNGEATGGSSQTKDDGEEDSGPEPEGEAESDVEEGAEAVPADSSMVVLEEENKGVSAGAGASEAGSATESESEDEPAPKQAPARRFFTAEGEPAPDSATEDEETDGEGAPGGAPKDDGDKTMMTAAGTDTEDED
ncbi:hypothetical protein FRC12_001536 [Ceratobasidium sp. 428]|nr:hypothetical protein FRC12_001536 [Ceratobasidium sp. 428]